MPVLQGTVQQVYVKKFDQPKVSKPFKDSHTGEMKTITSTHSRTMKINDQWVGLGDYSPKFDESGSTWTSNGTLQAGTEVVVNYTESTGKNGTVYKNTKLSKVMITGGKTDPVPRADQPQSSGGASSSYSGKANPAEVGQAINLAAQVLGYTQADFSDASKISSAVAWYKSTKEVWTKAFDGEAQAPAQAPKPAPVAEPEPPVGDDYIPF